VKTEYWWKSNDRGKITPTTSFVTHFTRATKEPMPTDSMNATSETEVAHPNNVC